jgi:hypothetical protein
MNEPNNAERPVDLPVGPVTDAGKLLSLIHDGWTLYVYRDEPKAEVGKVAGPWLHTLPVDRALVDSLVAAAQLEFSGTWSSLRRADCLRIPRG